MIVLISLLLGEYGLVAVVKCIIAVLVNTLRRLFREVGGRRRWEEEAVGGGGEGGGGKGGFEEVGVADERHKPVRSIECRYLEREVKY